MTITAARPVSHSFAERLHDLLSPLFAGKSAQGRLYRQLKDLPDYLLLDIGVDPREVPVRVEAAGVGPDLLHGGLAARVFRTVAKS